MSGIWTKAAAECDCHWGDWGRAQADWVALVAPSAQTLLLSGDSRAEGNNPHGQGSLIWGQGAPSPCSQSSDPSPSLAALEPCPLVAAVSLCPWHGLAVSVWGQWGRGAAGVWFLSEPGPAHSFVPLLGSGFGDSSVSPAGPAELSQPVGRSMGWAVFRTGMSCSSPTLGLVNSPHPTAAL